MLPVAILAGGLATRLRPLTADIPKALLPVAGEPFIAHQLRLLRGRGITRAVLCVGYRGEMIREYLGDGAIFGIDVQYSFDGPSLCGTAGAVCRALPLLGDAFFVLYGDSYLPCDYTATEAAFYQSGASALMTVFRNEGRWDRSNVEFDGARILAYDKKTAMLRMRHIDYGLGVFSAPCFERLVPGEYADLAAIYTELLGRGELAALEIRERFYEAGSFAGIEELEQLLKNP